MNKKIAIAVDGSAYSNDALRYAAALTAKIPGLHVVLLLIQPTLSLYLIEEAEKSSSARRSLDNLMAANRIAATQTLAILSRRLVDLGVAEQQIELKTQPKLVGVAEDLLSLCQSEAYDALVVGRRGISRLQEWIAGSVTTNLIEHSELTPIWVVDGTVDSADILLAVDGSKGALRALDHLCFMLSGVPAPQLHLFHVQPRSDEYDLDIQQPISESDEKIILSGYRHHMDDFFSQTLKVIEKYGIDKNQLHYQTGTKTASTAHAIVEAAQKGGFGTIVLGRRGINPGIFTGSVSRKVLQKVRHCAVWIVP